MVVRTKGSTEQDVDNLAELDEKFLQEMMSLVCPVLDELKIYHKAMIQDKKSCSLSEI